MAFARVGVVTGANKGIGYAIVRQLALQYPPSPLFAGPLLIYLTARDATRGQAAVAELLRDEQLLDAKALVGQGGATEIRFRQLDIADVDGGAAEKFADFVAKEHPEGIDFLINNAAVAMNGFDDNVVRQTLQTNFTGTFALTLAMLPILRRKPSPAPLYPTRIVLVSSTAGRLAQFSGGARRQLVHAASLSSSSPSTAAGQTAEEAALAPAAAAMAEFVRVVEGSSAARYQRDVRDSAGYPVAAYATSKAGVIAAAKALGALLKKEAGTEGGGEEGGNAVLLNACCPGWVRTDMTKGGGNKTPDQGAMTPVMLALADLGGVAGEFWRDEKVVQW